MTLDRRLPQRPLLTDLCRRRTHPARRRDDVRPPAAPASPGEVAIGIAASGLRRVVVVSAAPDEAFHGGGVLARALLETGVRPVLVDLLADGRAGRELGLAETLVGLSAVADGTAGIADAIHRDPFTAVHVVPSGGYDAASAGAAEAARIAFALSALEQGYGVSVVECSLTALLQTPGLLDAESGLIVSGSAAAMTRVSSILALLDGKGLRDGVAMRVARSADAV
ncbi:hypothetical protein [Aurantimonas sp. Leaf443]|uniref:hypothetical protein n=1 Tax=Aurantimonas sp. Leaf443 TaxID=1736378 RepID=UPI000A771785|nr:hypothetical protein [Aurantimonas sp. Leaf443]